VPENIQFSFSCSLFFYTVKLHSLTYRVRGHLSKKLVGPVITSGMWNGKILVPLPGIRRSVLRYSVRNLVGVRSVPSRLVKAICVCA